jgi:hypothetical protein
VLYCAEEINGAFAETFLRQTGRTLLPHDLVAGKSYVRLVVMRDIRLAEMKGHGLARMGATAEVAHSGVPYDVPQSWSKALREHAAGPNGIAYTCRHDDEAVAYALFDIDPLAVVELDRQKNIDKPWFWEIALSYGVGRAP